MISVMLSLKVARKGEFPFKSVADYLKQYKDVEVLSAAVPNMAAAVMSEDRLKTIREQMPDTLSVSRLRSVGLLGD